MTAQSNAETGQSHKLTMDERQQLDSDAIYRLNSALEQIRPLAGIPAEVPLLPAQLHKIRRGFQWMGVNGRNWQWSEDLLVKVQQALGLLIDETGEIRPHRRDDFERVWHEELSRDGARKLVQLRKDWAAILRSPANQFESFDGGNKLHRSLLELAGGTVTDGAKNIDGLVLRKIKGGKRLKYIYNRLLHDNSAAVDPPSEYECLYFGQELPETGWYEQRPGLEYSSRPEKWEEDYSEQSEDWLIKLHAALLDYDPGSVQGLISVPVYDAGRANDPWGRLVGIVHILVTKQNENLFASKEGRTSIIDRFLLSADRLSQVFRAIGRAEAAGAPVDRSRSKNGLATQHFLKRLPCFHDWQHVRARPLERHDGEDECWGRPLEGPGGWKRGLGTQCEHGERNGLLVGLNGLNNLLDLPWANPRDLAELGRLDFEFELPDYTLLPDPGDSRDAIVRQYQHELLDILRLVLPKVQRHRYAVRNAAVAIMSRNMSHNIGSHVLATVAAQDGGIRRRVRLARRNLLLRYLQERMDFVAEIATTKSYLSLPFRFKGIITSLDEDSKGGTPVGGQELLLRNICAVNNVNGTRARLALKVHHVPEETIAVDLPGGRHGMQALYVMIENIARNSAKHREDPPADGVQVSLRLDERDSRDPDWEDDSLMRVRIWDNARNARKRKQMDARENWERIDDLILHESIVDEQGALRPGHWGLRELAVATAYLRGVGLEDFESFPGQPPLLRTLALDDDGLKCSATSNLGYEFFLRRPRHIFVHDKPEPGLNLRKLARAGIAIGPVPKGGRVEHRYLVAVDSLDLHTDRLPARIISHLSRDDDEVVRRALALTDTGSQDLRGWCAEKWLAKLQAKHGVAPATTASLFHSHSQSLKGACGKSYQEIENLDGMVIFDHHHYCGDLELSEFEDAFFFEVYDDHCDQRVLVESPGGNHQVLEKELLAAALSRIMILDERVQEEAVGEQRFGTTSVPKAWALERRRILVPSEKVVALRSQPTWKGLESYIGGCGGKLDFLVVHLGILEQLSGTLEAAIEKMAKLAEEKDAELVICSGRGAPPQVISKQHRFVPLSSTLHWAIHRPSKFHLYELMCSARSPYA